jgi:hypothetical protein
MPINTAFLGLIKVWTYLRLASIIVVINTDRTYALVVATADRAF